MFKFVMLFACLTVALAAPGFIAEHHTVVQQPVLTKVGSVVHSAPSAVSHQSFSRVHNKAVIAPVVAPVVKTTTVHAAAPAAIVNTVEHAAPVFNAVHTPVVHAAPVVTAPVVQTVEHAGPVVKTVHSPVVQTYHAAAAVPVVKTVAAAPVVSHAVSHQSHVQLHSNAAVFTPLVHAEPVLHTVPVVHSAPSVHLVHH